MFLKSIQKEGGEWFVGSSLGFRQLDCFERTAGFALSVVKQIRGENR